MHFHRAPRHHLVLACLFASYARVFAPFAPATIWWRGTLEKNFVLGVQDHADKAIGHHKLTIRDGQLLGNMSHGAISLFKPRRDETIIWDDHGHTNMCIEASGHRNGGVRVNRCSSSPLQLWVFWRQACKQKIRINLKNTNACLSVVEKTDGAAVELRDCSDEDTVWMFGEPLPVGARAPPGNGRVRHLLIPFIVLLTFGMMFLSSSICRWQGEARSVVANQRNKPAPASIDGGGVCLSVISSANHNSSSSTSSFNLSAQNWNPAAMTVDIMTRSTNDDDGDSRNDAEKGEETVHSIVTGASNANSDLPIVLSSCAARSGLESDEPSQTSSRKFKLWVDLPGAWLVRLWSALMWSGHGGGGCGRCCGCGGSGDEDGSCPTRACLRSWLQKPLLREALCAGLLGVLGDLLAQWYEDEMGDHWDRRRSLGNFLDGLLVSGPVLYFGYQLLESLMPARGGPLRATLAQILIDEFVFDPILVAAYFFSTGIVEQQPLFNEILPRFKREYVATFCGGLRVALYCLPVQFVSFRYLPLSTRVLVASICDVAYDSVVSYQSHSTQST